MKIRRSLFTSVELWLLVAILGGMIWWDSTPAGAKETTSTTSVPVTGKVTGYPETVFFSGKAQVSTTLVTDPDFGTPPSVVISIDLSTVRAVGASTKKKYVISGPQIMLRTLASSDFVDFTFSFLASGAPASVRTGNASFSPIYKGASAGLRLATVTISTP